MMGMFPSQGPGAAALWGGQGFGGLGSPGAVPQQPAAAPAATTAPAGPGPGNMAAWWGGRGVGGPGQQLGATPGASFTNPVQGPDLWSRLMNAVGNPQAGGFKMPGTTIGAPAGQAPPAMPTPPPLSQMQGPMAPGANLMPPPTVPLGSYFRNQQFPQGAGNNSQLMAQYMALQQLMQR